MMTDQFFPQSLTFYNILEKFAQEKIGLHTILELDDEKLKVTITA